jgi:type II secretory pathway component PulC
MVRERVYSDRQTIKSLQTQIKTQAETICEQAGKIEALEKHTEQKHAQSIQTYVRCDFGQTANLLRMK